MTSLTSGNTYNGDKGEVVAWWCQSPFYGKRQVDGLGRPKRLLTAATFLRARTVDAKWSRGRVVRTLFFLTFLHNPRHHDLIGGIHRVGTTKDLGKARSWGKLRGWNLSRHLKKTIIFCHGCPELLRLITLHSNFDAWKETDLCFFSDDDSIQWKDNKPRLTENLIIWRSCHCSRDKRPFPSRHQYMLTDEPLTEEEQQREEMLRSQDEQPWMQRFQFHFGEEHVFMGFEKQSMYLCIYI